MLNQWQHYRRRDPSQSMSKYFHTIISLLMINRLLVNECGMTQSSLDTLFTIIAIWPFNKCEVCAIILLPAIYSVPVYSCSYYVIEEAKPFAVQISAFNLKLIKEETMQECRRWVCRFSVLLLFSLSPKTNK